MCFPRALAGSKERRESEDSMALRYDHNVYTIYTFCFHTFAMLMNFLLQGDRGPKGLKGLPGAAGHKVRSTGKGLKTQDMSRF